MIQCDMIQVSLHVVGRWRPRNKLLSDSVVEGESSNHDVFGFFVPYLDLEVLLFATAP